MCVCGWVCVCVCVCVCVIELCVCVCVCVCLYVRLFARACVRRERATTATTCMLARVRVCACA